MPVERALAGLPQERWWRTLTEARNSLQVFWVGGLSSEGFIPARGFVREDGVVYIG